MRLYKYILNTFVLPIGDRFLGGYYLKNIKLWKSYDSLSEEDLIKLQNNSLNSILEYAKVKVPHYKNIKLIPSNSSEENLQLFPILTKTLLRNKVDALISDDYNKSSLNINHSSGSTGVQSFTYMTDEHKFYLRALQTHWWNWSGFTLGDKVLQFGISQKRTFLKSLKDLFYRVYYNKAFGINETGFNELASLISKKNIKYIAGYPSVINQIAIACEHTQNLNGIISFGDKLFSHHEKNMKTSFGKDLNIIDTYGCAEGLLMACRKDTPYYYIMSPHVYIEIVDDNLKPVKDGEMGTILVTCLTNKAMPLIRYKLGDLGIKLPREDYPSHREFQYPLLKKIVGRETDVIKTKNGTILNVHSFTGVFEYFQDIVQYKIIQHNLESLIVEYISDKELSEMVLKELKDKFLTLTQSALEINFKRVNHIEPSKSGKPQIIESTIIK